MFLSRLKTPPIIHTEQELKEKIALLEVNRLSDKCKQGMNGAAWVVPRVGSRWRCLAHCLCYI